MTESQRRTRSQARLDDEPTSAGPSDVARGAPSAAAAGSKRRRQDAAAAAPTPAALTEDDFSCPICLNLLLDPVVYGCGHDICELCHCRWTRDQGKRSCPVCRAPLAAGASGELPGACLRLQRTLEALFPQRIRERQEEVAEEKAQLVEERRRAAEERRAADAQRAAQSAQQNLLLQNLLDQIIHGPPRFGGPGQQPQPQQQQQQQPAGQRQMAQRPNTRRRTAQQQQQQAPGQPQQAPGQQQQGQRAAGAPPAHLLGTLQHLFGLGGGTQREGPVPPPAQQLQGQRQAQGQQGAQPAMLEISMMRVLPGPLVAGGAQGGMQQARVEHHITTLALPMPAPVGRATGAEGAQQAGGNGAMRGGRGGRSGGSSGGAAAWPGAPPLEDMNFDIGWGEGTRRRRSSRGGRGGRG